MAEIRPVLSNRRTKKKELLVTIPGRYSARFGGGGVRGGMFVFSISPNESPDQKKDLYSYFFVLYNTETW